MTRRTQFCVRIPTPTSTPTSTPIPTRARTRIASLSAAVLLGLAALVVSAGPASAHDALVATSPSDGSTVATVPDSVVLTFEEPPVKIGMQVLVRGPGGSAALGSPTLSGDKVTQALSPHAAPGAYTVLWRVTSDDGHPVSGTFRFTARAASTATAGSTADEGGAPSSTPTATGTNGAGGSGGSAGSGGTSPWWWALALLLLVPVGLVARRARGSRPAH